MVLFLPLDVAKKPCRWLCGDIIGEGAFGTVNMGLNLDTGELMAVKSITLNQGDLSSVDATSLENELAILRDNKYGICIALDYHYQALVNS